jgi:endonuclease/exonuclease/phosphatase family metal-dependent hydrolase
VSDPTRPFKLVLMPLAVGAIVAFVVSRGSDAERAGPEPTAAPPPAATDTPPPATPPEAPEGDPPTPPAPPEQPASAPETDDHRDVAAVDPEPTETLSVRVRVVAANLSSGRRQSYDPGHGARILRALDPDVVLVQELEFHVYREPLPGKDIPNGVISRWPMRASGVWEDPRCPNREFAWAQIDIPGPTDLWAISLHLLTKSASVRLVQGEALMGYVREHVPEPDFLVIGGDLNTRHGGEPVLTLFDEVVSRKHLPVDHRGRTGTNASRKRPYDWVLPDADLEAHHIAVELADRRYPSGLVFDTRVFPALEALSPAKAEDSGAAQMQHMAVVRDFLVPVGD